MKPFFALALFAATTFLAPGVRADDGAVAPQTPAADAATPTLPGVKCVVRTQNGQTQFRQGATISLVASFTSDRPGYQINRFVQRNFGMARIGDIKITPTDGVTAPQGDLPEPNFLAVNGYVPEPVALSEKPVEFPFVLNDWARFDKPGVYQVTLSTKRVFVAQPGDNQTEASLMFRSVGAAQITSEPLQIEIVPSDEAWANQQIEITREFWRQQADLPRSSGLKAPANDISFLGTRAAMTAIIEHLSQNKQPRSSGDDTYFYRASLIGFTDRAWLIAEIRRVLAQPDTAVTQGLFDVWSELQSLSNTPRPAGADATRVKYDRDAAGKWIAQAATPAQQLQSDWEERLAAARLAARQSNWLQIADGVETKTPAARALTLHSLLELAWLTNLEKEPPIKAQLPQLVAQLAPIFDQLPPLARAYLLGDGWDRIKSPAFAPALQRARQLPFDKNDYYAKDAANLALKRLAELDPQLGRAQIIAQIKSPRPSLDFEALRGLPDATLPDLDDVLATNFLDARNQNIELAAKLLWRYASPAVLPRIKADYENPDMRYDNASLVATLAYLVRVDPDYGVAKVAQWARRSGKESDYSTLLFDVAELQPAPQLETVAIEILTGAGVGAARDAAQTLARIGSPGAQKALMNRLANGDNTNDPATRAQLEPHFVQALASAQGWLCPPDQLRQIRALCQTDEGRRLADEYLSERSDREPLVIDYSSGTREFWGVDRYNGRDLASLRAKLAQFPRGTEFFWQMTSSRGPDADRAFESTRDWAAKRGLKIEPHEKISARRKALGLG